MSEFIGDRIVSILRENSFEYEAEQLEILLSNVVSDDNGLRKEAIEGIIGLCQIQGYGNLNIKTVNGWKWNSMLEKLNQYVKKNQLYSDLSL